MLEITLGFILCILFVALTIKMLYKIVILMTDDDDNQDIVLWQDKYLDRFEKRCNKKWD